MFFSPNKTMLERLGRGFSNEMTIFSVSSSRYVILIWFVFPEQISGPCILCCCFANRGTPLNQLATQHNVVTQESCIISSKRKQGSSCFICLCELLCWLVTRHALYGWICQWKTGVSPSPRDCFSLPTLNPQSH